MPRVAGEEEHLGVCHEGSRAVGMQRACHLHYWHSSRPSHSPSRSGPIQVHRAAIRRGAVQHVLGCAPGVAPAIARSAPPQATGHSRPVSRPQRPA